MASSETAGPRRPRPLSPHLSIYRPIVTMVMSIMHRFTGIMNVAGLVLVVGYVLAVASGPQMFELANMVYSSWLGRIVLVTFTWSLVHHLLGGVRHAIWDFGAGYGKVRYTMSWLTLIGSVTITVLLWVFIVVWEAL
ncbi:MAG: succinate dehydrogenase, cytochrome b556 subunit [Pseudomonadota bacterium]